MAWDAATATKWGRANGYLSSTETASNGLLQKRVDAKGPAAQTALITAINNANAGKDVLTPAPAPLSTLFPQATPAPVAAPQAAPIPQPTPQQTPQPIPAATWMDPRNDREKALRDAGYTGAFGAGGGDAWLMDTYGNTQTPTSASVPLKGNWNSEVATSVGQLLGLLQPGQVATGGFLDAKVAAASPELQAEYKKIAAGLQNGTMTNDDIVNYFIDRAVKTQATDPQFGKLAEAPYKDFKPFSMEDFKADPGYQFTLDEGNKALDRAQSARGGFYSGAALKEASRYNTGMASNEYGNAYNRYNNDFGMAYNQKKADSDSLYNRLYGLSNSGQGIATQSVGNNANNANQIGSIYGQVGNVNANAAIASGNNISNILASTFGRSAYGRNP